MTENEAIETIRDRICNEKVVQRYCRDNCMHGTEHCAYSVAITALEEIQAYRAIGTVEECRTAVEKMKPKKPIYKFKYEDGRTFHDCPICGNYVTHALEQDHVKYCNCCGQALDWSE